MTCVIIKFGGAINIDIRPDPLKRPQIKRLFEIVKALPKESLFESVEEADRYFYKIMDEEIEKQKQNKPKS